MSDLTVTLKGAVAAKLRKLMAEEGYVRPEDALEGALDALDDSRSADIDTWLRDVVAERAKAFSNDPSRAMTPDEVRKSLFGKA
jgi:hypothetical protein